MKDFIKFMSVKTVINMLFMFLFMIPWWKISGCLHWKCKYYFHSWDYFSLSDRIAVLNYYSHIYYNQQEPLIYNQIVPNLRAIVCFILSLYRLFCSEFYYDTYGNNSYFYLAISAGCYGYWDLRAIKIDAETKKSAPNIYFFHYVKNSYCSSL